MTQAEQDSADWRTYNDLGAPAADRRAAVKRLAASRGYELCEHFTILDFGPCQLCGEPREKLAEENKRLQEENARLRDENAELRRELAGAEGRSK